MLGTDLVSCLRDGGHFVTPATRRSLDLCDVGALQEAVSSHDVVVNCAAWTAVDDAEQNESEAWEANAAIPERLAKAVARSKRLLVHVSTDYVFAGTSDSPYLEDAKAEPRSAYGRTKAAGEEAVQVLAADSSLIVRTAWLYGKHGDCFPKTMARLMQERDTLAVVDDQRGQPTWAADVADLIVRLVSAGAPPGVYHATSSGEATWFEFAREIAGRLGLDPATVVPTTSAQFPRPAPRPAYSVLGHGALERIDVSPIGDWRGRWRVAAPVVLDQLRLPDSSNPRR